jgi:hypothetical protein
MGLAANPITPSITFASLIERHPCDCGSSEEVLDRQWPHAVSRRPEVSFELVHATERRRLLPLVSG